MNSDIYLIVISINLRYHISTLLLQLIKVLLSVSLFNIKDI